MELKASKRAKIAPAIHTISFNCSDNVANTFLSQLAQDNRGRFHAFQTSDLTAQKFVHSLTKEETEKSDYAVSCKTRNISNKYYVCKHPGEIQVHFVPAVMLL